MKANLSKPLRGVRLLAGLLVFAFAPLVVCVMLYGHRWRTAQWDQVAVAFGWSAPRYPWNLNGRASTGTENPSPLMKLVQAAPASGPERTRYLHGLWLVLRESFDPFDDDPVRLVLWSQLNPDALWPLANSDEIKSCASLLENALQEKPSDLVLEADAWTYWPGEQIFTLVGPSHETPTPVETSEIADANPNMGDSEVRLWRALLRASGVLKARAGSRFRHPFVRWIQMGNAGSMWVGLGQSAHGLPLLDDESKAAYANALLKLCQLAPEHSGIPGPIGLLFGILLPMTLLAFSVLRWRRWRKEPESRPLLHPVFTGFIGVWLGLWLVLGPIGEFMRWRQFPAAHYSGDLTPVADAADLVGVFLENSKPGPFQYRHGWNLLTASVAVRVTNLGLWLVIVSALLWAIVSWRPSWARWFTGVGEPSQSADSARRQWLACATWSWLWLGLISLVIHAWCTLALCFCVNRMLVHS